MDTEVLRSSFSTNTWYKVVVNISLWLLLLLLLLLLLIFPCLPTHLAHEARGPCDEDSLAPVEAGHGAVLAMGLHGCKEERLG